MVFEDYCGSTFWNSSLTWNTTDPELTKCFEKTALVWVPSIFLFLFSPVEFNYLLNSKTRNVPWNWRNISKLTVTAALAILMIAEIIIVFQISAGGAIVYNVDYYTPLIKGVTLIWSGVLIWYNRKYGMMTSGLLFLYWLLMTICGIPQFRTEIRDSQNDNVPPEFYGVHLISLIYYILVVVTFLLNCLSDKPPKETLYVKTQKPCPELRASFLSKLVFAWFDGLIIQGYKKPLVEEDLWDISPKYSSREIVPVFEGHWKRSVEKCKRNGKTASFVPALFRTFGGMFFFGAFYRLVNDLLVFVNPNILGWLISFVRNKEEPWKGILYASLLFITAIFQSFFMQQFSNRNLIISMRIRSALISVIYKKSLVISNNARKESTLGEIVNLMSVDTNRFGDVGNTINILWSAPLQICLSVYFLWQELGPSVLAGLAVMLLLFPVNAVIANFMKKLQMKNMRFKDERIKLMNEILSGIRILKLYAWEQSFGEQLMKVRTREINNMKRSKYLQAFAGFIMTSTPFMVALATFATFVLIDEKNVLDATKAFVSLSLFNIIRGPLQQLPRLITTFLQMWVSVNRINKFLNAEEIDAENVYHESNKEYPIIIEGGTFTWDDIPILNDINLKVQANSLTAVVGNVGSGKTSLLSAVLGEMVKVNGKVNTCGQIAYLPQQAWIQNASLKDNILFGQPFDKDRYNRIIEACALKSDFAILPAGDETEIGEKGINLSGGQKQRVSLARAIYVNADIYLLDDPLSAVDSHVGKHIFDNVIGPKGLLAQKTRILVTHALTYLPQTDQLTVIKDGYISEMGTYQELLASKGAFSEFLLQYLSSGTANEEELSELKNQLVETPIGEEVQKRLSERKSVPPTEEGSTPEVNGFMDGDVGLGEHSGRGRGGGPRGGRGRGGPPGGRGGEGPAGGRGRGGRGRGGRGRGGPPDGRGRGGPRGGRGGGEFRGGRGGESGGRGGAGSRGGRGGWGPRGGRREEGNGKQTNGMEMKPMGPRRDGKLIEKEKAEIGNVKLGIYKYYLLNIGFHMIFIIFGFQLLNQGFGIGSNGWLGQWADDDTIVVDGVVNTGKRDLYLGVYGAIGFGQAFMTIGSSVIYAIATLTAASKIHKRLLASTLRLPMMFYDVTPIGRILSRFSSDIMGVDQMLPMTFQNVMGNILRILGTLVVIIYSTPLFVSVILPLFGIYYFIQRLYIATSRQLRRLVSVSRSPIFTHFGETLTGLQTIRAYGQEERFILECYSRIDHNQKCNFPQMTSQRWLAIRLEIIGNLIVFFAALFAVLAKDLSPALVGLSITYSMQITQNLKMLVNLATSMETNIISVERIMEYQNNEPEAAWEPANVRESWPEKGSIEFKNYALRYREGLDLVLHDINLRIDAGKKVGIVGRTGAGKSSITLALFRMIEAAEGQILIDDVDISQIGLKKLRSSLTIIPQDPALFAGSLRINLDPFDKHSDEELWKVLELAHLKHFVKGLPAGLQHEIIEGGANLSVGQKQLVCLARALLRETKILILDEATAAVDLETDDLIQKTIRSEFKECTVLTIAHRLNTVMDSDQIVVLDKGKIVEFDTPANLTANTESMFYGMYKNTNAAS